MPLCWRRPLHNRAGPGLSPGCYADDRSAAARLHQRGGLLRPKEQTPGVDVHRPIPAFGLLLHDRTVIARSRVVDENIQPAKFFFRFIEQALQVIQIANIRFDEQCAAAQLFDFLNGLFGGFTVAEEVDYHVRAVLGEIQRDRAANPATGAGDQSDFIGEGELFIGFSPLLQGRGVGGEGQCSEAGLDEFVMRIVREYNMGVSPAYTV